MNPSVPNENILKLRELSEELCGLSNSEYKAIVKKLKTIVDDGKIQIASTLSPQSKISCYESMCAEITNILSTVKFN